MKMMKNLVVAVAIIAPLLATAKKRNNNLCSVEYEVCFECSSCVEKVEKSIPYVKGVKDVTIDAKNERVSVLLDTTKNSIPKLTDSFERLKVEYKLLSGKEK